MPDASGPRWRKLGGSAPLIRFFFCKSCNYLFTTFMGVHSQHGVKKKKKKAAFDFMLSV